MPETADIRAYPPEAVLTAREVAAWLQVSLRTLERLDIPTVMLGTRTRRYLASEVLRYLSKRSE